MTQEEKQLLLADLSARLPYHVRCNIWLKDGTTEEGLLDLKHNYGDVLQAAFYYNKIKDIKPYLRPMSSMTEEEEKEYDKALKSLGDFMFEQEELFKPIQLYKNIPFELYEFFNSHHFDYRGLIPMGLALEAQEGMYNIKEK